VARKKKKQQEAGLDPQAWMLTFSDLVTLLLTFFVLLLSMSSMDVKRLQEIFSSFTGGKGVLEFSEKKKITQGDTELKKLTQLNLAQLPKEEILTDVFLGRSNPQFNAVFQNLIEDVQVKRTPEGVVLIFGSKILFDPGQAKIKPEALVPLRRVGEIIKQVDRPVSVEGHTDSTPVGNGGPFVSNWDLSMARALAVRDILVDKMGANPMRFRIAAMADSRPVATNDTPEGRSQNRRIEIIFQWVD